MNRVLVIFCLLIITSVKTIAQDSFTLEVIVTNLDSNDGKVYIGVYNTEKHFLDKYYKSAIVTIKDKTCAYTFSDLPKGEYAISLFHDENDNNKMDKNFMGIPKEDYACSNNAKGFMGPPKWEDAKFSLKSNTTKYINI